MNAPSKKLLDEVLELTTAERDARRARAEARRERVTLHKSRLGAPDRDLTPVHGPEALSLVTQLTRECWSWTHEPLPEAERTTFRFVPRTSA